MTDNKYIDQYHRQIELLRRAQHAIGQLISASMITGGGRYAALKQKQHDAHTVAVDIREELHNSYE